MKNPNIKLGDLVKLEGLEKPQEGLQIPIWGNSEEVNELDQSISDLAGNVEDHSDVTVSAVAVVIDTMKKALLRELAPEQAAQLFKNLKRRFEKKKKFYKSAEGINWEDVQAKLEASPEKLWSLHEMERTGGEPDLMEYDQERGEYLFMDCSKESPTGRRDCAYDREGAGTLSQGNAVSIAILMGVELLTESQYQKLQTKGEFDKNSWNWLKTPVDKRKTGLALYGYRTAGESRVRARDPRDHSDTRGFRASLRVK